MPTEEQIISQDLLPQLGQEVFDSDGERIGKVQARFERYILVERGSLFVKAYYVPLTLIGKRMRGALYLTLSEAELREQGYNQVPDDLYDEVPDPGLPQIFSGVPKVAKHPLSPAQTGHYHYGRRWPGINTDAAGSYHREEVLPIPQKMVEALEEKRRKA
jgi:hypothetical protein